MDDEMVSADEARAHAAEMAKSLADARMDYARLLGDYQESAARLVLAIEAGASIAEGEATRLMVADHAAGRGIDGCCVETARRVANAIRATDTADARARRIAAQRTAERERDDARVETARLHAIIEGRTTAPTDAELAAHDATGATWMIAHRDGQIVVTAMSWPSSRDWHVAKGAVRWWPLASDGRPCAWPEVVQRPAGCICDFPDGQHRFSCARQQPTVQVTRDEDGTFRVAGKDGDRG